MPTPSTESRPPRKPPKAPPTPTGVAIPDDVDDVRPQPGHAIVPRAPAAVANPFGEVAGPGTGRGGNALAAAVEQRAIAEIQTQFLMAERFRRDERGAMDGIITAFARPGLAKGSQYEYQRGGEQITGPSIRAAEAIAQQWGNIDFGFGEVSRFRGDDGVNISIVRARAVDLQSRVVRHVEFQVRHWRDTRTGGYALKDERDIYELVANQAQRRVRACILALIPGDVIEAAMEQAHRTLTAAADTSPENQAKIVAAFAKYGVTKDYLEARIQRRFDAITPAQVVQLDRIFSSMRDGMSRPSEWFDMPDEAAAAADDIATQLARRRAERRAEQQGRAAAPPPADRRDGDEARAKASTQGPKPEAPAAASPPTTPTPAPDFGGLTFAEVRGAMDTAKSRDDFDVAVSLISGVPESEQAELRDAAAQIRQQRGWE